MSRIKCLFGYHNYTLKTTGNGTLLCCICRRAAYYKHLDGFEEWWEYDEQGAEIHYKTSIGCERRCQSGQLIYWKVTDNKKVFEMWYDLRGFIIKRKKSLIR